METAVRVKTRVLPGHRVEFTAPELPEGADVEISVAIPAGPVPSIAARFDSLAAEWRRETAPYSSVTQIAMHPAYQAIIGMGWEAVPLILADLRRQPAHWFWALRAITGQNPVSEDAKGRVSSMADAWVGWGVSHGYIA